ncbi:hypothetical protein IFR05_009782 [Cadophora sp. M221]|nr:hypothetical protein IFR05_009782 [Cadophora sp. M221]
MNETQPAETGTVTTKKDIVKAGPVSRSPNPTAKMSDNDNSGKRVNRQPDDMALKAPTEQGATKITQSGDVEMIVESGPISGTQTEASVPDVTTSDPTTESTTNAQTTYKAADEGSKDIDMTSDSHALTEALMESLKSRDAADEPLLSATPQSTSGDIIPDAGGMRLKRPSHKRRSDEFAPASGTISDLPILKKSRQEGEAEVKPAGPPARKVYRGIGSGNGTAVHDGTSYSLPIVTPEQLARHEPDFVGEADYFNLSYENVQEAVVGTYMIVYSRPLDNHQQPYGAFETYPVDFHQKKIVVSYTGASTPVAEGNGKAMKRSRVWAEGEFDFNDCLCTFEIQHRFSDTGVQAVCIMKPQFVGDDIGPSTLDQVLALAPRPKGSFPTVSFGMKHMRTTTDESGMRPVYLGFKFISMNLATWDVTSGEENLHRVVGIKIPPKKDVASAFILNQRVVWPMNPYYLISMPSLRAPPAIPLGDLERKKGKVVASETKQNSWVTKAEVSGRVFTKKGESSSGGNTQMD